MEWTVTLDQTDGFVRVVTCGVFAVADHVRMIEDILERPFWHPGMHALFDHRALDFDGATLRTMREASANHLQNDERIGDGRAALVVADLRDFGNARQFELLSVEARAELGVFLDMEAAQAWLRE